MKQLLILLTLGWVSSACTQTSDSTTTTEATTNLDEYNRLPISMTQDSSSNYYLTVNFRQFLSSYRTGYQQVSPARYVGLLFKSTDSAATWTNTYQGEVSGSYFQFIRFAQTDSSHPFQSLVDLQISGGGTISYNWNKQASGSDSLTTAATVLSGGSALVDCNNLVKDSSNNLYVACGSRPDFESSYSYYLAKSTDNGDNWSSVYTFSDTCKNVTDVHVTSGDVLIASGGNTICRSTDAGASFTHVEDLTVSGYQTPILTSVSSAGSNVYYYYVAASETSGESATRGIRKSTDAGVSFTTAVSGSSLPTQTSMYHITPDSSGNLYAVANEGLEVTVVVKGVSTTDTTTTWKVYKSTDGAVTWSLVDTFNYNDLGTFASMVYIDSSDNVFVGGLGKIATSDQVSGSHDAVLRRGTDGGTTWTTVHTYTEIPATTSAAR